MAGSLRVALRSLRAHPLRSALTMLGIVIGIASVVVIIATGTGARERIAEQIRSIGANLVSINPGSARATSVRLGSGNSPMLSEDDAAAIAREIPGLVAVAPVLYARAQFTAGASNWAGGIRGVTPDYFSAREWIVADGQEMTPDDDARAARVLLLGTTLRDKLFGDADAIGTSLRIRDVPFTVIGILERKGQSVWGEDQDDVALVPLTTARRHFVGTSRASPRFVHNITVKFGDASTAEDVMAAIADLLRQRHGLGASRDESFLISNLAEAAGVEETTSRVVSTMLTAVASVSLVVGGIGVMNIMLVTVAERTREIGLRLAVGARRRDVVAQFLVEAAALATLGGVVGAVAGLAGAVAIGAFAGWPVVIDLSALIAAVAIAAITGLVFGVFPAVRAARLDPMAALRME